MTDTGVLRRSWHCSDLVLVHNGVTVARVVNRAGRWMLRPVSEHASSLREDVDVTHAVNVPGAAAAFVALVRGGPVAVSSDWRFVRAKLASPLQMFPNGRS